MFRKSRSKSESQTEYQCTIRFLDDSEPVQLTFMKDTAGQVILEQVCNHLNLVERDYFGLRFVDSEKQRHWLDPVKTVYKQLKDCIVIEKSGSLDESGSLSGVSPCVLCFRVKFYPADPMKLHEEITRYYLFLQLRRDLHHGRLLCSPADANMLAAYIIQSELGDYDPQDHPPGYVAEFKMLPKQNLKMEEQILEIHKTLVGQVPAEAEGNFLKKACTLDTYGVDPHQVKDQKGTQLYLGVTHQGIMTFHGSRRTQMYKWTQIKKIAYEGKMFIVHVNITDDEDQTNTKKKHQPVGYKCLTVPACKYLWRCAVEQQFFFTNYSLLSVWRWAHNTILDNNSLSNSFHPPKVRSGGNLFSRGSKFRFSGRCQNEAYSASDQIKREEPNFQRSCSLPNFTRRTDPKMPYKSSGTLPDSVKEDKSRRKYNAVASPTLAEVAKTVENTEHEKTGSGANIQGPQQTVSDTPGGQGAEGKGHQLETKPSPGSPVKNETKPKLFTEIQYKRQTSTEKPLTRFDYKHTSTTEKSGTVIDEAPAVRSKVPLNVSDKNEEPVGLRGKSTSAPSYGKRSSVPTVKSEPARPFEVKRRSFGDKPNRSALDKRRYMIESPVDVPGQPASTGKVESLSQGPIVQAPMAKQEDAAVDEIMVEQAQVVQSSAPHQQTPIPTVNITPATPADVSTNYDLPVYQPEETIMEFDHEPGRPGSKSLEDQVLELEEQFNKLNQEANHVSPVASTPVKEDRFEPTKTNKSESAPNDVKANAPQDVGAQKKAASKCSCCRVLVYTFFFIFLTLTVTTIVIMFSNIQHPVVNELRQHLTFLEPARDFIQDKYRELFKKS